MDGDRDERAPFRYEGFAAPTFTSGPDDVFDVLMPRLSGAELRALLYIVRRTFGFKRDRDPISLGQFLRGIVTRDGRRLDAGCGVRDRTTLSAALRSLEAKGIIVSEKATDERGDAATTVYRLRFRDAAPDAEPADVGKPDRGGRETRPTINRTTTHRITRGFESSKGPHVRT